MNFLHYPVMNKEVVSVFKETARKCFVDCTAGLGGHSYHLLKQLPESVVVAIDCDPESLKIARENLAPFGSRVRFLNLKFEEIVDQKVIWKNDISGVLVDPGISTFQLKHPGRGFSHTVEAPLDMRKDRSTDITAFEVLHSSSEKELAEIFQNYGEVQKAPQLAKKIIEKRLFSTIDTTTQLRELVEKFYSWRPVAGRIHPAAKVFQALRIFINSELAGIERFIKQVCSLLKKRARLVFLTYHSLEDRLVKRTFTSLHQKGIVNLIKPFPILPQKQEVNMNPPSRSAKLRAVEVL